MRGPRRMRARAGPTSSSCPCRTRPCPWRRPGPFQNCGRTWPELEPNLSETSSKPRISSATAPFDPVPVELRSQQRDLCCWAAGRPVAAGGPQPYSIVMTGARRRKFQACV
jgi:hypothetical protein